MENEGKGLIRVTDFIGAKRIFACNLVTTPTGACVCFTVPGVRRVARVSCGRDFDLLFEV